MSNQRWCIEQIPGEARYRCVKITKPGSGSNQPTIFSDLHEVEDLKNICKGSLHYTFSPEEYYLFADTFPKLKPDLLKLQIDKRFRDLGLTMDTIGYTHRAKESSARKGHHNCIFAMESELQNHLAVLTNLKNVKKAKLVPAAASIAALLGQLTDKAVLVLHIGTRFSQVLVTKGGDPLYNQSLPQAGPGLVEEALVPNAVDFARLSVRKDHDIEDLLITTFGKARNNINLEAMEIEEWQPDFSTVAQAGHGEALRDYPQLYGSFFCDKAYDFLPVEFTYSWTLQNLSKMAAVCASITILGLLAGWYYLQPIVNQQRVEYHRLLNDINQKRTALVNRLPKTTILNNFDRIVNIRSYAEKDFRLDTLAQKLSIALPQKVHVTDLQIRRQADSSSSEIILPPAEIEMMDNPDSSTFPGMGPTLSVPEQLQSKNININITCTSSGSYSEVTTRFEKTAKTLSSFFGVEDLTWSYREADTSGRLTCTLFPPPQEVQL